VSLWQRVYGIMAYKCYKCRDTYVCRCTFCHNGMSEMKKYDRWARTLRTVVVECSACCGKGWKKCTCAGG